MVVLSFTSPDDVATTQVKSWIMLLLLLLLLGSMFALPAANAMQNKVRGACIAAMNIASSQGCAASTILQCNEYFFTFLRGAQYYNVHIAAMNIASLHISRRCTLPRTSMNAAAEEELAKIHQFFRRGQFYRQLACAANKYLNAIIIVNL